jgi:hypothetical protein
LMPFAYTVITAVRNSLREAYSASFSPRISLNVIESLVSPSPFAAI